MKMICGVCKGIDISVLLSCDVLAAVVGFSLVLSYEIVAVAMVCEGVWACGCLVVVVSCLQFVAVVLYPNKVVCKASVLK
jgi:hypothetical protein